MSPVIEDTREAWLGRAAKALADLVLTEHEVPAIRISVGFPKSRGAAAVGQCWSTSCAADDVNQVFICPSRGEEETVDVLGTLLHEMIHAVDDCDSGHRGNFAKIAKSVGFEAPLTSSSNRSEALTALLQEVADLEHIGLFPHAALDVRAGVGGEKKQGTRQLKVECPSCGYIVRTTRKWLDLGTPTCVCGTDMQEA